MINAENKQTSQLIVSVILNICKIKNECKFIDNLMVKRTLVSERIAMGIEHAVFAFTSSFSYIHKRRSTVMKKHVFQFSS